MTANLVKLKAPEAVPSIEQDDVEDLDEEGEGESNGHSASGKYAHLPLITRSRFHLRKSQPR